MTHEQNKTGHGYHANVFGDPVITAVQGYMSGAVHVAKQLAHQKGFAVFTTVHIAW